VTISYKRHGIARPRSTKSDVIRRRSRLRSRRGSRSTSNHSLSSGRSGRASPTMDNTQPMSHSSNDGWGPHPENSLSRHTPSSDSSPFSSAKLDLQPRTPPPWMIQGHRTSNNSNSELPPSPYCESLSSVASSIPSCSESCDFYFASRSMEGSLAPNRTFESPETYDYTPSLTNEEDSDLAKQLIMSQQTRPELLSQLSGKSTFYHLPSANKRYVSKANPNMKMKCAENVESLKAIHVTVKSAFYMCSVEWHQGIAMQSSMTGIFLDTSDVTCTPRFCWSKALSQTPTVLPTNAGSLPHPTPSTYSSGWFEGIARN
jgi:hypothetical protein